MPRSMNQSVPAPVARSFKAIQECSCSMVAYLEPGFMERIFMECHSLSWSSSYTSRWSQEHHSWIARSVWRWWRKSTTASQRTGTMAMVVGFGVDDVYIISAFHSILHYLSTFQLHFNISHQYLTKKVLRQNFRSLQRKLGMWRTLLSSSPTSRPLAWNWHRSQRSPELEVGQVGLTYFFSFDLIAIFWMQTVLRWIGTCWHWGCINTVGFLSMATVASIRGLIAHGYLSIQNRKRTGMNQMLGTLSFCPACEF